MDSCAPADAGRGHLRGADGGGCATAGHGHAGAGAAVGGAPEGGEGGLSGYWRGGARYRSAARVVLVGHGADELCGGYGRHRRRFCKQACFHGPFA